MSQSRQRSDADDAVAGRANRLGCVPSLPASTRAYIRAVASEFPTCHYSKRGIEGMREVRLLARILRHGLWHTPLPGVQRRTPPGWSALPRGLSWQSNHLEEGTIEEGA